MAGLLFFLTFSLFWFVFGQTFPSDNLQVAVPTSFVNGIVQSVIPTLEAKINAIVLPTCCYDDVGVSGVHLNFEQMTINDTTFAVNVEASNASLGIVGTGSLKVLGFYRLCIHDDPFSSHACSTIGGCKGNFVIPPELEFGVYFAINATETGHLEVTALPPTFSFTSFSTNLCDDFQKEIEKYLPEIDEDIVKVLYEVLGDVARQISADFPTTLFHSKEFNVSWALSDGSSTQEGLLVIQGETTVVTSEHTTAPFGQREPIPRTFADDNLFYLRIGESMLSNVLFGVIDGRDIALNFNMTVDLEEWNVHMVQSSLGPTFFINGTNQELVFEGNLSASSKSGSFAVQFLAYFGAEISVAQNATTMDYYITLQLDKTSGIRGITGNCPQDCNDLINKLDSSLSLDISVLDGLLKNIAIPIPLPKGITLTKLYVEYGDAYSEISAIIGLNKVGGDEGFAVERYVDLSAFEVEAIQCPNIPHAHQDQCI